MIKQIAVICLLAGIAMARPQVNTEEISYSPYEYSYQVTDEDGNQHGHSSSQDSQGFVTGTMLVQLANGLFKTITYRAGPGIGFVPSLESNMPGLGAEAPAGVEGWNVQEAAPEYYEDRGLAAKRF